MLTLLALTLLFPAEGQVIKLKVGDEAPGFALKASNGSTVRLADFKGKKKVVLAFFPKAFTGGCTREVSALRDNQRAFDESSAQILAVSMDTLATQTKFAESLKLTFPVLADPGGTVASSYGVKGALWANRSTFVINDAGKIIAIMEGKDAAEPGPALAACRVRAP